MFELLANHLSEVYPFAKVFAGTTNYQKTKELPEMAIFVNRKVRFVYNKGASLERMFLWLKKNLKEVKLVFICHR